MQIGAECSCVRCAGREGVCLQGLRHLGAHQGLGQLPSVQVRNSAHNCRLLWLRVSPCRSFGLSLLWRQTARTAPTTKVFCPAGLASLVLRREFQHPSTEPHWCVPCSWRIDGRKRGPDGCMQDVVTDWKVSKPSGCGLCRCQSSCRVCRGWQEALPCMQQAERLQAASAAVGFAGCVTTCL